MTCHEKPQLLLRQIQTVIFISSFYYTASSDSDASILLQLKNSQKIQDPGNSLSSWRSNSTNPCSWNGVSCNNGDDVVSINLSGLNISGEFSKFFCKIKTLEILDISDNNLGGPIESDALSLCSQLISLNVSSNYFMGPLPDLQIPFQNLRIFDFSMNSFSGEIPASVFANLPRLELLSLGSNYLNGSIPESLSNLTELTVLVLSMNPLNSSPMPRNIGRLTKLKSLVLESTNLTGEIPESVGNLGSIENFDVSNNKLEGKIPLSIGGMKSAEQILLYNNLLSGELPDVFSSLTSLVNFDASQNKLNGKIPHSLAALHLKSLHLNDNSLEGIIPEVLALNPLMSDLKLFNNSFTGNLSQKFGLSSNLEEFDVSGNSLEGPLPQNLCRGNNLRSLILFKNRFSGPIPNSYGECKSLTRVRIQENELSDEVPDGFFGIDGLELLDLSMNKFEGSISPSISKARSSLRQLVLSDNNFSGSLTEDLCGLQELRELDLVRNHFSSELPICIGNLIMLEKLLMQENNFAGAIPSNVAGWRELTQLNLSHNRFSGEIPSQLGFLPVLTALDLSSNLLSGEIPSMLTKLRLNQLNLSNNRLVGRVPLGYDTEFFVSSLAGNMGLCSPDLKPFPDCPKSRKINLVLVCLFSVLALTLMASILWLLIWTKKFMAGRKSSLHSWKITSFQKLGFSEEILTSLTDESLIGVGSSGQVYRARLSNGQNVAVKVLREGKVLAESEDVFASEVETLGRIRHLNIVKLLFSCKNEEGTTRLLVYDYMENGSLGDFLHGDKGGIFLDWPRRYGIMLGSAHGLAYLHHDCVPPIVHRDFKSHNILLDGGFTAKVADFGLAKILRKDDEVMSRVAGTYGYIAPEYAYTMNVTEKSDVYSFGIMLLELITGKRPNEPLFGDNKNIIQWVTTEVALSSSSPLEDSPCLARILDSRMSVSSNQLLQVERALGVALMCTAELPSDRPSMRRVVELLKDHGLALARVV